jgi:lysophospholipase L1-like esterase
MRVARLALCLLALAASGCTRQDTPAHDSTPGRSLLPNALAATSSAPLVPPPSSAAGPAGSSAPAAPGPSVSLPWRFVGRWVPEPSGTGMRCGWSGTYVVGRFKGTTISARIKDEGFNLFQIVIDGEPKKVIRTTKERGEALYLLADGLPDAVHEISLHRRVEAKVGEAVFYGFEAQSDGKPAPMLPAPPAPERRIETLGDSISTGFGVEGPNALCGWVNGEQNEWVTYHAIAARNLNADHTTIAWSGKTIHEMQEYFDKSLPNREHGPIWDFSQYQPQVVVINLGTNNFAIVDPGEARYVKVYLELVAKVRAAYPKAFIVCALGSMLSDVYPDTRHNLTQARKYMKAAVAKLKESGEANLDFLEFPEQNHADGLACGFHPSSKTHKLMADRLTAFIKERMAW